MHRSNLAWIVSLVALWPAMAQSFDPDKAMPADAFVHLSFDAGAFRAALPETPLGRMAAHPGFQKALGRLPDMLRAQLIGGSRAVSEIAGVDVFELLDLLSGKWTLVAGFGGPPPAGIRAYAAFEMGDRKEPLVPLIERWAGLLAGSLGAEPQVRDVDGVRVTTVGPLETAVTGNHLLLVMDRPGRIDEALRAGSSDAVTGIASNEAFRRSREHGLERPIAALFADVRGFREAALPLLGPSDGPRAQIATAVLAALGLDKVGSITCELGLGGGDWEVQLHVESPGGLSGFLAVLAESFQGARDAPALDRVPASATSIGSFSIDEGRLFRGLEELARSVPPLQGLLAVLEERTGLSLENDLKKLPALDVTAFEAPPPAGGFHFDSYAVVKISEAVPYLAALNTFARHAGGRVRVLQLAGRDVVDLEVRRVFRALGFGPSMGPLASLEDQHKVLLVALDPTLSLSFAPIDEEWMVAAGSPQALERYLVAHASAPKAAGAPQWKAALEEAGGERAVAVLRESGTVLSAYNTVVTLASLLGPTLDSVTRQFDMDLAALPPAEEFAEHMRPGFLTLRSQADSLTVRGRGVLTHGLGPAARWAAAAFLRLLPMAQELR